MKYGRRDSSAKTVSLVILSVLIASDLVLVAGGAGLPLAVRIAFVVLFAAGGCLVVAALPSPFRLIWLGILGGLSVLALVPPIRLADRAMYGAALVVAMLVVMLWLSRKRRKALWAGSSPARRTGR